MTRHEPAPDRVATARHPDGDRAVIGAWHNTTGGSADLIVSWYSDDLDTPDAIVHCRVFRHGTSTVTVLADRAVTPNSDWANWGRQDIASLALSEMVEAAYRRHWWRPMRDGNPPNGFLLRCHPDGLTFLLGPDHHRTTEDQGAVNAGGPPR